MAFSASISTRFVDVVWLLARYPLLIPLLLPGSDTWSQMLASVLRHRPNVFAARQVLMKSYLTTSAMPTKPLQHTRTQIHRIGQEEAQPAADKMIKQLAGLHAWSVPGERYP